MAESSPAALMGILCRLWWVYHVVERGCCGPHTRAGHWPDMTECPWSKAVSDSLVQGYLTACVLPQVTLPECPWSKAVYHTMPNLARPATEPSSHQAAWCWCTGCGVCVWWCCVSPGWQAGHKGGFEPIPINTWAWPCC